MRALFALLAVLGQTTEFGGVTYGRPEGWTETTEGTLRALVAPRRHEGQLVMVTLAPAQPAAADPAAQMKALVAGSEVGATILQRGAVQTATKPPFTILSMAARVEQPGAGEHERLYELVTDGRASVFAVALIKGQETLAENQVALLQLLASVRPSGPSTSAPPVASLAPPSNAPEPAAAPGAGIPYGPSTVSVTHPDFRPSGHGKPIPPAKIVDGRPVGLWWGVDVSTLVGMSGGSVGHRVFFPDGTFVREFRPGGPRSADLDGMRATGSGGAIGTYSVTAGVMTTVTGDAQQFRTREPLTLKRNTFGQESFVWDGQGYNPAVPITPEELVGTYRDGARSITFRGDGTVTSWPSSFELRRCPDRELTGRWALEGYILAVRYGCADRVVSIIKHPAGGIILGGGIRSRER